MKKKFMVRSMLFAAISAIVMTSCSKEELGTAATHDATPAANTAAVNRAPFGIDQSGSVSGEVTPVPTKAKLTLYDGNGRMYGPYHADRVNGSFRISGLVTGTYKLVIEYPNVAVNNTFNNDIQQAYFVRVIEVVVTAGSETNLGVIDLR